MSDAMEEADMQRATSSAKPPPNGKTDQDFSGVAPVVQWRLALCSYTFFSK